MDKNKPKKENKKLSKKDKKDLERKELRELIKEEKYKNLGYTKTKEDREQ